MTDQVEKPDEKIVAKPSLVVYPLRLPIVAYGEEVSVITMRRPNGQDLLAIGNPVVFFPHVDPPRIEHDYDKVIAMVARLSDPKIPSTSLVDINPKDLTGLAWAISPFFTPAR